MKLGVSAIISLLVLFGGLSHSMGQVTTATLYGTVTDASRALIPAATVTMRHEGTGAVSTKTADENGQFVFTFLPVGSYTLKIEMPGFKTYVSSGFELGAAQNVRRTFILEVGGLTEQVTVTDEAPLVNTVSPEQRQSFSKLQITELPLSQRNVSNLLSVGTGVIRGDSGNIRFNGVGRSGTRISVDGTEAVSDPESPGTSMKQAFNYIDVMSVEAIQEVQTTKGIIAAEYADVLTGNVNLITRSGTNQWHGSLFENYTGAALNARHQNASSKPGLTFNQYGGSLGGPIRKNKVFIFGAYEGYQERAGDVQQGNVPTVRLRNAMLAAVPEFKTYLDIVPLPNQPHDPNGEIGRVIVTGKRRSSENLASIKSDLLLFGNTTLAVTYTRSRPYQSNPRISESNPRVFQGTQERVTASYVIGRPKWTSETRLGYSYSEVVRGDGSFNLVDPKNKNEVGFGGRRVAEILGLSFSSAGAEYFNNGGPTWTLEHKVSRIVGRHALKFGGWYANRGNGRKTVENPEITYANERDLLANIPNNVRVTWGMNAFTSRAPQTGLFIQDDWRTTSKLTINLGVRYDYYGVFVAKPKNPQFPAGMYNFDGLKDPYRFIFGPLRDPKRPIEPDGINFGPRFGFAYNPDGQSRNVIRGGFGVMFAPLSRSALDLNVGNTPTWPFRRDFSRSEAAALGLRYPIYNDDAKPISEAENRVLITGVFEPKFESAYVMNMYMGVERELTRSMMIESAFVGTRGVKFLLNRVFNQIDRVTGLRPNVALGHEGQYFDPSQQTFYASWQTSFRKRYSSNLSWNVHHTWAKALSYGGGDIGIKDDATNTANQDFNDIKIARGPSVGDRTHVVSTDWVYALPLFTRHNRLSQQVLGGWQVSGILRAATGAPVNVMQRSPGGPASRPDVLDIKNTVLKDYRKTGQYFNKTAFAAVPVGSVSRVPIRPGTAGFNAMRGPGYWTADLSAGKNVTLREELKLQFRVDMFNTLNHTNLGTPVNTIEDPNFGRIFTTQGARTIQFHARLSF